ncbi:MAG: N-acetylmuramic acid 6-phosphate etherase [Myxococcaceae bacterium]|nr:N-acetylmuramic acid 6-phosphate etherase [Myxococcaceae bacterium]
MKASSTEERNPRATSLGARTAPVRTVRLLLGEERKAVAAVARVAPLLGVACERIANALEAGGRLVYLGAGTSGRLGTLDAAECGPTFGASPRQVLAVIAGGPRALRRSAEGAEDDEAAGRAAVRRLRVGPRDVVCGISASGRTPYVRAALVAAKRQGAFTLLLSCNPAQARGGAALVIAADTGPELIAGSTRLKAGTATKLMLNALSTGAFTRLGRVERGRMVALRARNQKLQGRAIGILEEATGCSAASARRALRAAAGDVALALRRLRAATR